jgi:hypothetical protein
MLTISLSLLTIHYIADFGFQTDWQAQNKSKNWNALLRHTTVYSLCFFPWGLWFVLVTFLTHTITDAITSRINTRLWQAKKVHWFFAMIGLDQLIHFATLALTYRWLYGS